MTETISAAPEILCNGQYRRSGGKQHQSSLIMSKQEKGKQLTAPVMSSAAPPAPENAIALLADDNSGQEAVALGPGGAVGEYGRSRAREGAQVYTGEPWAWSDITTEQLTLPTPWNDYIFGEAEAPKMEYETFCKLLATLTRRVSWCENQRRVDRARIEELEKEQSHYVQNRIALERRVEEMNKFMAIPEIVGGKPQNVRPMTTTEAQKLETGLKALQDGDRKLEAARDIMGQPVSDDGAVEVDIEKATIEQRWLLYYLISNFKIKRTAPKGVRGRASASKMAKSPVPRSVSVASIGGSSFADCALTSDTPPPSSAPLPDDWLYEGEDDDGETSYGGF